MEEGSVRPNGAIKELAVEGIKYEAEAALIWRSEGIRNDIVFYALYYYINKRIFLAQGTALPVSLPIHPAMTEYDYSPEAYERFMATQTRISNWIDNVSQSMQTPSPTSRHSYDHHHSHHPQQQQSQYQPQRHSSRPIYSQSYPQHHQQQQQPQQHTHSNSHSQTHSRTNSLSRRSSRTRHQPQQQHYQDPTRPRSYSQTGGRPQAVHSHTAPIPPPPPPMHSRTYSYAMNQPGPPLPGPIGPIPVPPPVPYPHMAPRRSRTLPPQTQNVVYHTYDAPRGGPTYVMVPPGYGGVPQGQQYRMPSPVRIFFSPIVYSLLVDFFFFLPRLDGTDEKATTTTVETPFY